MGQEKQQEVPCKQQETPMMFVLDSPSMRMSNLAVSMTGCHGSGKLGLEVTEYTVSWAKLWFKTHQLKSQKSDQAVINRL
jgi:hypothetical protein